MHIYIYVYLYENVYFFKLNKLWWKSSRNSYLCSIFSILCHFKTKAGPQRNARRFFFFFFNNLQYFPELFPPLAGSGGSFRGGLCEISGFVGFTSLTPAVFGLLMAGGLTRPQRKHKVRVHLVCLTVWSWPDQPQTCSSGPL